MKYLKCFENYSSIENYLSQAYTNDFEDITSELYDNILEEGFVDDLENFYGQMYNQEYFEYTVLNISEEDQKGLIEGDDDVINKFNEFDLELKKEQGSDYPTICDFIDYKKGIVYIIRLI